MDSHKACVYVNFGGFLCLPWCQAGCILVDLEFPSPQTFGWCGLTGPLRGRQWPGLLHSFWVSFMFGPALVLCLRYCRVKVCEALTFSGQLSSDYEYMPS